MNLAGVFAPVPTPFDEQDRLDVGRLREAFGRWVASPLTGFVVLGSTGEAVLLDEAESDRVIDEARTIVPKGRLFIVGSGRESTKATIAATRRAADLGADAVLVRTPGFFKTHMTTDVLVWHYTAVADASPVPVLLYNFTAATGVDLPVSAVCRLSSHPNVAGMKESGGADIGRLSALVSDTPPSFHVLTGSATTFYPSLCVGAAGGVLALACVVPDLCVHLLNAVREGRHEDARSLQERLNPLARLLGSVHGVPGLKAALNMSGIDVGWPRRPLAPADDTVVSTVVAALATLHGVPA